MTQRLSAPAVSGVRLSRPDKGSSQAFFLSNEIDLKKVIKAYDCRGIFFINLIVVLTHEPRCLTVEDAQNNSVNESGIEDPGFVQEQLRPRGVFE